MSIMQQNQCAMLVQVGKKSAYILNLRFCSAGIFYVTLIYLN